METQNCRLEVVVYPKGSPDFLVEAVSRLERWFEKQKVFREIPETSKLKVELGLVSEKEIFRLNRLYRQKSVSTDVLSFPTYAFRIKPALPLILLGSIIICESRVRAEMKVSSVSEDRFQERVNRLVIHAGRHLLGRHHNDKGGSLWPETA